MKKKTKRKLEWLPKQQAEMSLSWRNAQEKQMKIN